MIFTLNQKTQQLSFPNSVKFKDIDIFERGHLEQWILKYPNILGLNEDILILTNEYDKFDKTNERIDILALDKQANLIVIELKRDDSGKYVDLQSIKYAAYCSNLMLNDVISMHWDYLKKEQPTITEEETKRRIREFLSEYNTDPEISKFPRIILVARDYRPEVTSTVLWLLEFEMDIICIKLTPYKCDEHTIAIESNILIPLPETKDFIISAEKKEKNMIQNSVKKSIYFEFWTQLIANYHEKNPEWKPISPSPNNTIGFSGGSSKMKYSWKFRQGHPFCVEFMFSNEPGIIELFQKHETYIIEKVSSFEWDLDPSKNEKKLFFHHPKIKEKFENLTDSQKNELIDWGSEIMKRLVKEFSALLQSNGYL